MTAASIETRPCTVYTVAPEQCNAKDTDYDLSSQELLRKIQSLKTMASPAAKAEHDRLIAVLEDRSRRNARSCKLEVSGWVEDASHPPKSALSVPQRGPPEHWAFCYRQVDPKTPPPSTPSGPNAPWAIGDTTYTIQVRGVPREFHRMAFKDLGDGVRSAVCGLNGSKRLQGLPEFMLSIQLDTTMHATGLRLVRAQADGTFIQVADSAAALVPMLFSLLIRDRRMMMQPKAVSATVYALRVDACNRPMAVRKTAAVKFTLSDWGAQPITLREFASAQDASTGSLDAVQRQIKAFDQRLVSATDSQKQMLQKMRDDLAAMLAYIGSAAPALGVAEINRVLRNRPFVSMVPDLVSNNDELFLHIGVPYASMALDVVPLPPPPPPPPRPVPQNCTQVPDATPWNCNTNWNNLWSPLRRNASGNIECMSRNARDCMWQPNPVACERLRAAPPPGLQPLVCGAMHREKWGYPGYGNPASWCHTANMVTGPAKRTVCRAPPPPPPPPRPPPPPPPKNHTAVFYQHANYGGRANTLGAGRYGWIPRNGIQDNSISSLITRDVHVTMYEHGNFRGRAYSVGPNRRVNFVGPQFNDKASSIVITKS